MSDSRVEELEMPRPCTCTYGFIKDQRVDPSCVYHGSNWVRYPRETPQPWVSYYRVVPLGGTR